MKVLNRIKEFAESRGLTAYAVMKASGVSEPTLYRLYSNPELVPSGKVLEALGKAYPETSPGDWLKFEREEPAPAPKAKGKRTTKAKTE